ncbi:hypothetical protein POSPLADRAFT_1186016 [Postia placenta MAD-698-R-SB12]|uniref:Uncharacterized protein n=1 Tax=Postia placenta MAD-698-R-SB12 TaxID=670580 RepID=A0A1X6MLH3_9APHY|nr:hypothetical protein POSPLADRAFT_1186016 [Postia placenta MAD-698-R-SB12]OSX57109.1 hypothetical protein POSPLADRAFT_1186016 [Postia placenta MAD-698-R-SB12]
MRLETVLHSLQQPERATTPKPPPSPKPPLDPLKVLSAVPLRVFCEPISPARRRSPVTRPSPLRKEVVPSFLPERPLLPTRISKRSSSGGAGSETVSRASPLRLKLSNLPRRNASGTIGPIEKPELTKASYESCTYRKTQATPCVESEQDDEASDDELEKLQAQFGAWKMEAETFTEEYRKTLDEAMRGFSNTHQRLPTDVSVSFRGL